METGLGGFEMALGTSGSWPGALRVGPPVRGYTGRRNSARRRGRSQSVHNAWLPSDPGVKLLSGPLSLEAGCQGGRAASYLSARQGLDFINREASTPGIFLTTSQAPSAQPRGHARPLTQEPATPLHVPGRVTD